MRITATAPITIQPWPLPVVPHNGNTGIVPPWLIPTPVPPTDPRPWWVDGDWDQERPGYKYR